MIFKHWAKRAQARNEAQDPNLRKIREEAIAKMRELEAKFGPLDDMEDI
jgi:hypothetical protein